MPAARARWGLDALEVQTDDDPFGPAIPAGPSAAAVSVDVEAVGLPIELADDLAPRLVALLKEEGELLQQGVTCAIKDRDETSCHACPLRGHQAFPASRLCVLGVEQERVFTHLAVSDARRKA